MLERRLSGQDGGTTVVMERKARRVRLSQFCGGSERRVLDPGGGPEINDGYLSNLTQICHCHTTPILIQPPVSLSFDAGARLLTTMKCHCPF